MNENGDIKDNIYRWLDQFKFSRNKKNIAKDFSDGVLMAELLKEFFPKLVDLHNYSSANKFDTKMYNWETINKKILVHLGLLQSKQVLIDLANSVPGTIEKLLFKVRKKIITDGNNEELIENNSPDYIPRDEYDEITQQLRISTELNSTLNSRIKHLETLIEVKNQRIRDLIFQLDRCHEVNFDINVSQQYNVTGFINLN